MKLKNKWSILFVTSSSTALIFLDNTVMPVALPTIQKELLFSHTGLVWIVNIYLLTMLTFLLIGGRLCDLWGMRKTYGWGLFLFGLGSLLSGLSFFKWMLLGGRFIQGIGGALTIPTTGALIIDTFPPGARAKAIGINTGIGSLFLVLGPVIGGVFTEYWNWRGIFWINIPVVIFAYIMVRRFIPKSPQKEETFHLLGAFPLAISVIFLVVGFMEASNWGWNSGWTWAFILVSPLFFLLFIWLSSIEKHPIIDFSVFKQPFFRSATFCIFITQFLVMATVLWALYFQQELGYSAAGAGILILIATIPVIFVAPIAGIMADRIKPRIPIVAGFALLIFSLLWFVFFPSEKSAFKMLPGLLGFGCGIPLIMSPAFAVAMSYIPVAKLGTASAMITTIRQLASTLGIALMTAIFYSIGEKKSYRSGFTAISFMAALFAMVGLLYAIFFIRKRKYDLK